jgi:hypothetical protein
MCADTRAALVYTGVYAGSGRASDLSAQEKRVSYLQCCRIRELCLGKWPGWFLTVSCGLLDRTHL